VVYERLIHNSEAPFPFRAIQNVLQREGLRVHPDSKTYFKSVILYLEHLERARLIRISRDARRTITPLGSILEPAAPRQDVAPDERLGSMQQAMN
jgi:hypothetical protein